MRDINKLLLSLMVFVLVYGLVGCSTVKENDVLKIRLVCADMCKQMKKPPFKEKVINDTNQVKTFMEAINEAELIKGKLDYGAVFRMYVSFKDGTEKEYVLNITDKQKETALVVDMAKSEQGYSIPREKTDELRAIIYKN